MPVAEVKARTDRRQFRRLLADYQLEPWEESGVRMDRRFAALIGILKALKAQESRMVDLLELVNPWAAGPVTSEPVDRDNLRRKILLFNAGLRGLSGR